MRTLPLQLLTWGTIVAAVVSAIWLAAMAPMRPFGANHGDTTVVMDLDLTSPENVPAAGAAASAPPAAASPATAQRTSFQ